MTVTAEIDPIREAFDQAVVVAGSTAPDPAVQGSDAPPNDFPPTDAYEAENPAIKGAGFPLTDYGNGQRLVHYNGDDFLWVPRLGWYRWDDTRWRADEDEILVRRDAQSVAARIEHEIACVALDDWRTDRLQLWYDVRDEWSELDRMKTNEMSSDQVARLAELGPIRADGEAAEVALRDAKKAHRNHARSSGNTGKISNMLTEAQVMVAKRLEDLNADPMAVCVENGVLRFSWVEDEHAAAWGGPAKRAVVELVPHSRDQFLTKKARANYDPSSECPTWIKFLERVLPDPEVRAFLHRWFGYCLTGDTTEHKLAFLYGRGRNGKSTAVDLIAKIMDDYGTTIPIETLTGTDQRKGSDATPDLVRVIGARFVRASEPEQGQKMKEALIKALTGGESFLVRRMMQEFVEVQPDFKLTISGNYKPEVRGTDDGIWERIMLVPFTEHIRDDEKDPRLGEKLWAERDGILAWMVQGCLDWMSKGLRAPDAIREATEEYRRGSDPIRVFLETECEITGHPSDRILAREFNEGFQAYILAEGQSMWRPRHLSNQIKQRVGNVKGPNGENFDRKKAGDWYYVGVRFGPRVNDWIAAFGERIRAGSK